MLKSDIGAPPVVRGTQAPDFTLEFLAESGAASPGSLSLSSLEGRVVLVNFWATWCVPCESEMPAMERLYAALPRDRFELVAVAIDETLADVEAFQARYQLSFPIVLDPDQATYQAYQTMGVPESLLVDASGRIVERYVGPRDWDAPEYQERLMALIEGRGEVPSRAAVPPPGEL